MTDASRSSRRTFWLVLAVCLAPLLASYAAYYLFPRDARVNYGELLPTQPLAPIAGTGADGKALALAELRGAWLLVTAAPAGCDLACAQRLYATRQSRTIQGREQDRVKRVWLVTDDAAPAPALLAQHPDLMLLRVAPAAIAALPRGRDAVYLVDPLGNQVLAWPPEPDIKAMAKDLTRLLKASGIG